MHLFLFLSFGVLSLIHLDIPIFGTLIFRDIYLNSQQLDQQRMAILISILRIFSSTSWISSDHVYSRSISPFQPFSFCSPLTILILFNEHELLILQHDHDE